MCCIATFRVRNVREARCVLVAPRTQTSLLGGVRAARAGLADDIWAETVSSSLLKCMTELLPFL